MLLHTHALAHVAIVVEGCFAEVLPSGTSRMIVRGDAIFYPAEFAHEVTFGAGGTKVASVNLNGRMVADYGLASLEQALEECRTKPSLRSSEACPPTAA